MFSSIYCNSFPTTVMLEFKTTGNWHCPGNNAVTLRKEEKKKYIVLKSRDKQYTGSSYLSRSQETM